MTNCYHCGTDTVSPIAVIHKTTGRIEVACPNCVIAQADSQEVTDDM